MMKPSATDHALPAVTAATVWRDVPEPSRSLTTNGFQRQITAVPVAAFCHRKDFYSRLILDVLEIDRVVASVKPAVANYFGGLHGGAVAAIAEAVSIACARTVVAEDKDLFLGEMAISYLAAAPQNVSGSSGLKYDYCNTDLQTLAVALLYKNKEEWGSARAVPVTAPMPKSVSF